MLRHPFPARYLCTSITADGRFEVNNVGLTWRNRDRDWSPWANPRQFDTAYADTHARPCQRDIGEWDQLKGRSAIMYEVMLARFRRAGIGHAASNAYIAHAHTAPCAHPARSPTAGRRGALA